MCILLGHKIYRNNCHFIRFYKIQLQPLGPFRQVEKTTFKLNVLLEPPCLYQIKIRVKRFILLFTIITYWKQ